MIYMRHVEKLLSLLMHVYYSIVILVCFFASSLIYQIPNGNGSVLKSLLVRL